MLKILRWIVACGIVGVCGSTMVNAQQLAFSVSSIEGTTLVVEPMVDRATAVIFLGTECPMARAYAAKLNALQAEFESSGLRIVGVMSNRQDSLEDVQNYARELETRFPLVKDEGNRIADRYGASRTPEVFLLDDKLKLRYHGRIDDQYAPGVARNTAASEDLQNAVRELLAGKPVSIPETRALGCIIGRVKSMEQSVVPEDAVTYTQHVARVLNDHCVECHRTGEVGPFAMESYEEIVGWAETMLETVDDGRMPPWHADRGVGSFLNERFMPEADKQILRDWIAGGMPQGDPAELPDAPEFVDGWQLPRAPDMIVEMRSRPFVVAKSGVVEYQYFVVDPNFEHDMWVTAAQAVPGAREVVHHALVFVRPPDGASFEGVNWLTAYVPGQRIYPLPDGYARRIPAGSKLVFQMHYTPNGVEQGDISKVGMLFCKPEDVTHQVMTLAAINQEFVIPPNAANHTVTAQVSRIPPGAKLLAATPHMHFRGKAFKLLSDRSDQPLLLDVPDYDFNWQHTYLFSRPLPLDDLGSLHIEATFDNSAANPFNPDPSQMVTWGDQTWEEMALAFFEVAKPLDNLPTSGGLASAEPTLAESKALQSKIDLYVARVMEKLDANHDGLIKKSEADIVVRHMNFGRWDLNGDNVATEDEIRRVAKDLF